MKVHDLGAFRKERKAKSKRRRLVGARSHMAWFQMQTCCRCHDPIMSGMTYIREVWAIMVEGKSELQIFKYHAPECPGDLMCDFENKIQTHSNMKKVA